MIGAVYVGVAVLAALTVFQLLLIAGRPLGEYAWGGRFKVLPTKLRISSAISIALYGIFTYFLMGAAGLFGDTENFTFGAWIFGGYFALNTVMNMLSRNKKERAVMTPAALVLAVVFVIVAANGGA